MAINWSYSIVQIPINVGETYKYLGTINDQSLTLGCHFDESYKRTSSKLRLLSKTRTYLTQDAGKCIHQSVIIPEMIFNCISNLNLSQTQKKKLKSLDSRVSKIINRMNVSTLSVLNKHAVALVRKCIDGDVCSNFQNYFEMASHERLTRNTNFMLKIPRVKLEFDKQAFYFMGFKLYNTRGGSRVSQRRRTTDIFSGDQKWFSVRV